MRQRNPETRWRRLTKRHCGIDTDQQMRFWARYWLTVQSNSVFKDAAIAYLSYMKTT
jgi:hypothetical protein